MRMQDANKSHNVMMVLPYIPFAHLLFYGCCLFSAFFAVNLMTELAICAIARACPCVLLPFASCRASPAARAHRSARDGQAPCFGKGHHGTSVFIDQMR
jgi:hypothetical protein